jgi:hypothetical protein
MPDAFSMLASSMLSLSFLDFKKALTYIPDSVTPVVGFGWN